MESNDRSASENCNFAWMLSNSNFLLRNGALVLASRANARSERQAKGREFCQRPSNTHTPTSGTQSLPRLFFFSLEVLTSHFCREGLEETELEDNPGIYALLPVRNDRRHWKWVDWYFYNRT